MRPTEEQTARIILEDGTEFEGIQIGYTESVSGEILFYTGKTSLPRLLTDPALRGAILILADPLTATGGVPYESLCPLGLQKDFESPQAQVSGIVVSSFLDISDRSNDQKPLSKWLKKNQITGISGIDTRALIQRVRTRGSMRAKILISESKEVSFSSANLHLNPVQASTKKPLTYGSGKKKIVLVDCGVRNSTIRRVTTESTTVLRVPATYDFSHEKFDALIIAGGPGDPTSCTKTIENIKVQLSKNIPILGIAQGAVILALSAGASAFRMPNGHRGAAVPCINLENGRCYITAQNHGYGIRDNSLPSDWNITYLNNNDQAIEGFSTRKGLISGVLFNPEGLPGPSDTSFIYTDFLTLVENGGLI